MTYLRDPQSIIRESFDIIARETDLTHFDANLRPIAVRIIHACGMTDIADDIICSPRFAHVSRCALQNGAHILCDSNMTAAGIKRSLLPDGDRLIAPEFNEQLKTRAAEAETTQSALVAETWGAALQDAVVVIGNAPTALFRLLELLTDGSSPVPAAIIGIPVGFVGASESKQKLIDYCQQTQLEFLTVRGRRGGSAIAAAAVNAVLLGLSTSSEIQ